MESPAPVSKGALWTGRVLSALAVLVFVGGGIFTLLNAAKIAPQMAHYGFTESHLYLIAWLEIVCGVIYAIPHTARFRSGSFDGIPGWSGGYPYSCRRIAAPAADHGCGRLAGDLFAGAALASHSALAKIASGIFFCAAFRFELVLMQVHADALAAKGDALTL